MRVCPRCQTSYPNDMDACASDGVPLGEPLGPSLGTDELELAATASLGAETAATASERGAALGDRSRGSAELAPVCLLPVAEAEDLAGRTIGAYRVLELIGKGGMGRVYLAEHARLGRKVALKVLRPEYAAKRDSVARFFQEAKAVNRIRHRNIVDVTDFLELADGTTFIIMELLVGVSLGQLVREGGPLAVQHGLSLLTQVCDALAAAHAVDIIHRDLKPDNVFVVPPADPLGEETVKLLDFGVAKLAHEEDGDEVGRITAEGSVVGTPAYMSPEQAGSGPVDARSDVYSLGAIMYEIFTGEPPFKGRSFGEYIQKHAAVAPVPPSKRTRGGQVGPALEAVILRCLAKRPDERYATVSALREDLLRLQTGELSELRRRARNVHRLRRVAPMAVGMAVLLAGLVTFVVLATHRPRPRLSDRPALVVGPAASPAPAAFVAPGDVARKSPRSVGPQPGALELGASTLNFPTVNPKASPARSVRAGTIQPKTSEKAGSPPPAPEPRGPIDETQVIDPFARSGTH